jgi:hypothetical protein
MDPTALVSRERADRAAALLRLLPNDGLVAVGALWAQTEGDGRPYLYVVTPNVESEGPFEADLRLGRALRTFQNGPTDPFSRIDPFEIKLIGPSDPLARELLGLYKQVLDPRPTVQHAAALGHIPRDGAYVYPATMFPTPTQPPSA